MSIPQKSRTWPLFGAIFIAILFSSCSSRSKTFSNAAKWLPPDFDPKTSVLLVDTAGIKKKQVEKMTAHLVQKYPYEYRLVSSKQVGEDEAYSDTRKYRFMMVHTFYFITLQRKYGTYDQTMFDFYFLDRFKDLEYPKSFKGSSWASATFNPLINTILKERVQ